MSSDSALRSSVVHALVPRSPLALVEPALAGGLAPGALPSRLRVVSGDYAVNALRLLGDMQVHCVLAFDRHLDERRLARALRLALDAEPVLGCRFVPGVLRSHWLRRDDLDALP